jgi:hypothetical protein
MIGILSGHGETVVPQNPEYSAFFDLIREYGRRIETLEQTITYEALADFPSLLIGEPHRPLQHQELNGLRKWLAAGGSLLALWCLGGDHAPAGDEANMTNLSGLLVHDFTTGAPAPYRQNRRRRHMYCRLAACDNAVGVEDKSARFAEQMRNPRNSRVLAFNTKVHVDISALVNQPAGLCYDTGCTLRWYGDSSPIINRLPMPTGASTLPSVRLQGSKVRVGTSFDYDSPADSLFLRVGYAKGAIAALGSSWVIIV